MPIVPVDLEFHLSQPAAGRGMEDASAPAESLGGFAATTIWGEDSHGLFPDITGSDNERGVLDVRCLFVLNRHEELSLLDAAVWMERKAEGGAFLQLAVDPTPAQPAKPRGKARGPQALTWDPADPPSLEWRDAEGRRQALPVGTIPPGHVKAFWIKRQAHRLPAIKRDFFLLRISGDTTQ